MRSGDPILRAFERRAECHPHAPVVISSGRSISTGELDRLAEAVSAALRERRFGEDAPVVLSSSNGPAFLASLLALRRAGLVALLVDSSTPSMERERIARRLGAAAILECRTAWPDGPGCWRVIPILDSPSTQLPGIGVVKLTSGSSGDPVGIASSSEALLADEEAISSSMGLRETDRFLAAIPFSHAYGLSVLALTALTRGSTLVLPEDRWPWSPLTAARRAGATVFPTAPAYLEALLGPAEAARFPTSLRLVISAGSPLAPATARRFRETFGLPVHTLYGASECGGICCDREGSAAERGTVGTPLDGVRVRLEAHDEGTDAGVGRIVVHSPAVAASYLPEPTAGLRDGVFRSGDLGSWVGGELKLAGRNVDWIDIRGRKVNPREVEAVLCELTGVREAVVLGMRLPEDGEEIVRAVIACDPDRLDYHEVASWCGSRLARHKVPRSIVLVREIPRTGRGKLDRAALLMAGSVAPPARG